MDICLEMFHRVSAEHTVTMLKTEFLRTLSFSNNLETYCVLKPQKN